MRRKATALAKPAGAEGRPADLSLLLWLSVWMILGFLLVLGTRAGHGEAPSARDLLPPVIFAATLLFARGVLALGGFRGDPSLVFAPMFLSGVGILAQFRMGILYADPAMWTLRDLLFPLGVTAMLAMVLLFRRGRLALLRPWYLLAGAGCLGLVGAVLATGARFRGAVFASGRMTPTEALKILVSIAIAGALHRHWKQLEGGVVRSIYALVPFAAFWALLLALLVVQRDLGMAFILSVSLVAILAFNSGRISWLVLAGIFAFLVILVAGDLMVHSQRRMEAWLDPFQDPTGAGWQTLQGLSAMFAGGLYGSGFGLGRPDRIPIAESDFIYAVIAEEFGFIGCLLVVAAYLILIHRGLRVARDAPDPFIRILVSGLILILAVQTLVNIGGVTKAIPLTGVPLPFVSLGGSSLLVNFIAMGLVLAASDSETRAGRGRK